MFGLGMSELIVLGVLALILIGPKQLPEVARTLGRFLNDLKRSAEGLTEDIKNQAKVDLDFDSIDPRKDQKKKKPEPEEWKPLPDPEKTNYSHEDSMKPEIPVLKVETPEKTVTYNPDLKTETEKKDSEKKS